MATDNSKARLFVGCAPNGEDAESQAVLEYSVRKHASLPVEITWMKMNRDPRSPWYCLYEDTGNGVRHLGGWISETWQTPFSPFRWTVPEACGFEGKAVYCDSDFVFLSDIANLWNQEFGAGSVALAKGGPDGWRYCLTLWNCPAAKSLFPSVHDMMADPYSHQRCNAFMLRNPQLTRPFSGNWNCVDGEDVPPAGIDALHYSDMSTQFHLDRARVRLRRQGLRHWFDGGIRPHWRTDLQRLFDDYYIAAVQAGYGPERYEVGLEDRVLLVKRSQVNYGHAHRWSR
jgi:hypothetical protein